MQLPPACLQRGCATPTRLPAEGLCNSTANQAVIAALRADLIAKNQATDVTIFCVDAPVPGRRLLAGTQAEYTASVCSPEKKVDLPVGTQTGEAAGCIPALPTQPSVSAAAALQRGAEGACLPARLPRLGLLRLAEQAGAARLLTRTHVWLCVRAAPLSLKPGLHFLEWQSQQENQQAARFLPFTHASEAAADAFARANASLSLALPLQLTRNDPYRDTPPIPPPCCMLHAPIPPSICIWKGLTFVWRGLCLALSPRSGKGAPVTAPGTQVTVTVHVFPSTTRWSVQL